VLRNNLRVQRSLCALFKEITLLFRRLIADLVRYLFDSAHSHFESLSVALDNDLGVHSFLNEGLGLAKELTSDKHN